MKKTTRPSLLSSYGNHIFLSFTIILQESTNYDYYCSHNYDNYYYYYYNYYDYYRYYYAVASTERYEFESSHQHKGQPRGDDPVMKQNVRSKPRPKGGAEVRSQRWPKLRKVIKASRPRRKRKARGAIVEEEGRIK